MNLETTLTPSIHQLLQELYGEINVSQVQLQKTRKDFEGDITLVVFPFLKQSKKGPEQTGEEIGAKLVEKLEIVTAFNTVKGFLNLSISDAYWLGSLAEIQKDENFGLDLSKQNLLMVEYSSPNTNKPLHLGHLRNNFLGHSVSRILEASGNEVVKTQIINDRGIHICKSMLAWQRFGNGGNPSNIRNERR
jgi:arginyl-tRNA synthetase